jgi:histone H1/5|uniref:H15 domain-containing protein n=1 Tax=Zea mays TaxID=4577 RepID=A0A804R2U1_MAIZE
MATVTEEVAPVVTVSEEPAPEAAKEVVEKPEEGKKPDEEGDERKKADPAAEKEKKARKPRSRKPKSAGLHHPPYFEVSKDAVVVVVVLSVTHPCLDSHSDDRSLCLLGTWGDRGQMIKEAILSQDGGKVGASPYAIAKHMGEKHRDVLPPNYRKVLAVQLRGFAAKGRLVKVKASFKLAAAEERKPSAAAKAKKKASAGMAKRKRAAAPAKMKPAAAASAPSREARKVRAKRARKVAPAPAQPKPKPARAAASGAGKKVNKASA